LYHDKGFHEIRAKAGALVRDSASRLVTITIAVNEGPQTRIDSISIKGSGTFTEEEIRRFMVAQPLAPYSPAGLSSDQRRICDSMAAHGYPLCTVKRVDGVDSVAHTAFVSFIVDQGPLALADAPAVIGAKRLRQVIVKRGLTIRRGDTLTTGQVLLSMRRLYETGMFKYVRIETPIADSAQIRQMPGPVSLPVLITIEEADFFRVQGGAGYGTYEGARLSVQTSYGNVLGLGRTAGFDGSYSRLIRSLHLRYSAPWFLLLPPTAEAEAYGEYHNEVTFTGYLEGLTFSFYTNTRWRLGYRVFTTFEWVQGKAVQPLRSVAGQMIHTNTTQSFGIGASYDIRNNIFDPLKGLFVASDAELAGLVGKGTNHFYKFMMDARGYVPIGSATSVASAAMAAYVNGYGIDKTVVPPQELYYAGSEKIRPVRGYTPGGVGDSVGGRLVLVINVLELRLALTPWLKIAGFADAGFAWISKSLFAVHDLRWTAGPGIRIRTPIGMLSTDLGIRLNGPTFGKFGFSVNIGEPF
jgi:outer membrane protein assembly factor BamA